ncbi:hypothetical protein EVAR_47640_1 [Eumeta japonica]|uniref:Uncharacterized protein n=1 Tax=Eumeta variegata TaxID=151549 RepID=A0A4C1ZDL6_EUMVA|nr:hypothetical protein EVAR_47640_1 [Eumeta japonica]
MYVGEQHRYRSRTKHILNRIGLKPAASQAMSNYERTGHTVVRGYRSVLQTLLHCGPINIPPLTNMEATGCRLAMTGHSTRHSLGLSPVSKTVAPARPKSPLCLRGCRHPLRCSYQPRQDSGRGERAGGSGILGSPEVSADILELIRAKTQLCAARISHSRVQIQSAALNAKLAYQSAQNRGYTTQKPDNSVAIDDAEIAECLADSIETQCSHASPPHDIAHISRIEEEVLQKPLEPKDDLAPVSLSEVQTLVKSLNTRRHRASMEAEVIGIHKPGNHATSCQLQTDQPPERSGQTIRKNLKTRLSDHLLGKALSYVNSSAFPSPFLSTASPPLSRVCLGGFETKRSTVAVFFDVRPSIGYGAGMSALTRQDVLSEQEFLKAPPSLLYCCTPRTQTMYRDRRRLASNSRYSRTIPRSLEIGIGAPDSPSSPQRAIDELGQWFRKWRIEARQISSHTIQVWTVMTYASPVFAHAAPKALHRLQVIDKLPYSTRPLTASGRAGKEPTRDGFLRHPMPRRLPPGVVHSACHAPSALAVRPHSVNIKVV